MKKNNLKNKNQALKEKEKKKKEKVFIQKQKIRNKIQIQKRLQLKNSIQLNQYGKIIYNLLSIHLFLLMGELNQINNK